MKVLKFLFLFVVGTAFCQMQMPLGGGNEISPVQINYALIPDLGGTEVANYGVNLNFGKRIGKSLIGLRLGYQNFTFNFNENTNLVDLSTYENLHSVRAGISYVNPLKNSWSLILSAGTSLMSNFGSDITAEDFVYNAVVAAVKRWGDAERNSSLLVGAIYGTQFGEPRFFPAISYRQQLDERWSYSLGIPVTGLNYRMNERHRLSLLASPQGLFANNSNSIAVDGSSLLTNTKLQFNGINTRLSYRYMLTKKIALTTEAGIVPRATLKILDSDNEEIVDLDPGAGAFFNIQIGLVLDRRKKLPGKSIDKE